MFDIIKDLTKNKNLVIFGEIHGTKEIPEMISQFFSEIAKEEDFDVCLEIPEEFQKNIKDFFVTNKYDKSDGRNSLEYFKLIQNMENLNRKYNRNIKIFCIDANSNTFIEDEKDIQNIREKIMAENILKSLDGKKSLVVLGSIHASKYPIFFNGINIIPAGSIIFKKLNDNMFSINILPKKGKFFNFGLKEIRGNKLEGPFNKNFDYIYDIGEVTSCSFVID